MCGGVVVVLGFKGADAGADGTTRPGRVVGQTLLSSIPTAHTLTPPTFYMLGEGKRGGRCGRREGGRDGERERRNGRGEMEGGVEKEREGMPVKRDRDMEWEITKERGDKRRDGIRGEKRPKRRGRREGCKGGRDSM